MRSAFLALTNFGCQYQFGWWLIGIEGDGAVTNKDGQAFNLFPGTFFAGKANGLISPIRPFVSQTTERWIATARLRLGWAADKWLFFVTGGGAWSGVEVTVWEPVNPTVTAHHKKTLTGWTVGARWEYALGYGWSWKSEFLYIDYGWTKFFDPADTCSPSCDAFLNPREVSPKNYVFRTGLNWRFDWGKAPVAVMAKSFVSRNPPKFHGRSLGSPEVMPRGSSASAFCEVTCAARPVGGSVG